MSALLYYNIPIFLSTWESWVFDAKDYAKIVKKIEKKLFLGTEFDILDYDALVFVLLKTMLARQMSYSVSEPWGRQASM